LHGNGVGVDREEKVQGGKLLAAGRNPPLAREVPLALGKILTRKFGVSGWCGLKKRRPSSAVSEGARQLGRNEC